MYRLSFLPDLASQPSFGKQWHRDIAQFSGPKGVPKKDPCEAVYTLSSIVFERGSEKSCSNQNSDWDLYSFLESAPWRGASNFEVRKVTLAGLQKRGHVGVVRPSSKGGSLGQDRPQNKGRGQKFDPIQSDAESVQCLRKHSSLSAVRSGEYV